MTHNELDWVWERRWRLGGIGNCKWTLSSLARSKRPIWRSHTRKHDSESKLHGPQYNLAGLFSASVEAPPKRRSQVLSKGGRLLLRSGHFFRDPEPMPRFGTARSHRHKPTPLNPQAHCALSVRTREVKAQFFQLFSPRSIDLTSSS